MYVDMNGHVRFASLSPTPTRRPQGSMSERERSREAELDSGDRKLRDREEGRNQLSYGDRKGTDTYI